MAITETALIAEALKGLLGLAVEGIKYLILINFIFFSFGKTPDLRVCGANGVGENSGFLIQLRQGV